MEKTVTVKRAHATSKGSIVIDLNVNGVDIYGAFFRTGVKDDKVWRLVSYPSYKGSNDKYYNHCWVGLSKDDLKNISDQIDKLLNANN